MQQQQQVLCAGIDCVVTPSSIPTIARSAVRTSSSSGTLLHSPRPASERPLQKLTAGLMQSYNTINAAHYAQKRAKLEAASAATATATAASSSRDDSNFIVMNGELLKESRYVVCDTIGKGSFGRVVKAFDHHRRIYVAIKIIKNKTVYFRQAQIELKLLASFHLGSDHRHATSSATTASASASTSAASASASASASVTATATATVCRDSDLNCDRFNLVQMLDSFMHLDHQCIVFELLSINLYEFLRSTHYFGFDHTLVGAFAHQLLMTLAYLNCKERGDKRIIHGDLKPENIVLRAHNGSAIKVIDFGTACFVDAKIHHYIQSRFYRAPEIIFGLPYNAAIDMWSLGCILFELCTGSPLFNGTNSRDQLQQQVQLLGLPPVYMIEKMRQPTKVSSQKHAPHTRARFSTKTPPSTPFEF